MRPIALALALFCLAPFARAGDRPRGADDGPTLSDDSRWMSFIRLVGSRWRIRTQVPPPEDAQARRLLEQCLDDAWYLALPVLVEDAKSPCNVLVDSLKATDKADRPRRARDEYRRAFSTGALAPSREQYDACTAEAVDRADPDFLTVCALALKPRASLLASLTDQDRFGGWMGGCKKAMLGDVKPGETARQVQHTPAEDRQARHCLRTLPTLYEVQWLKKLSDFWTPEELRQLNLRSQQLGRN